MAICSGQTNIPRKIRIEGVDNFRGKILHSSELHTEEGFQQCFQNKRVLVVGAGETASDMVLDICQSAAKCDVSIRNPVLVLQRNLWGAPPDFTECRTLYWAPRWVRFATYKSSILTNMLFFGAFARKFKGKTVQVPSVLWLWKMLFTPKYLYEVIMGERSACSSIQTTKSDNIMIALRDYPDKCHLRSGVAHIDVDGHVVFSNSKECGEYDVILLTTGYKPSCYPFFCSRT